MSQWMQGLKNIGKKINRWSCIENVKVALQLTGMLLYVWSKTMLYLLVKQIIIISEALSTYIILPVGYRVIPNYS